MRFALLQRVVLPIALGALGVAGWFYGALWNTATVIVPKETTISITVDATGKPVPPHLAPLVGAGPAPQSNEPRTIGQTEPPPPGTIGMPPIPGPDGALPGLDGGPPGAGPPGLPPELVNAFMPPFSTKTLPGEPVDEAILQGEPALIREVSIGGLVLSADGLRRTYLGEPPSLCPT